MSLQLNANYAGEKAVDTLTVNELSGDFGVVQVQLAGPLEAKGLATTRPTASGKLTVRGVIERAAPLLQVLQASDTRLPYRGSFAFTEAVAPTDGRLGLTGGGTIDNFELLDDQGKSQFAEKQVKLDNDLAVDLASKSAAITNLNLALASSQAATVRLNGGVQDWAEARKLKSVVVHVDADGPKVWPLVYAFLPPGQQTQFKDAKLTGPVTFDLTADGSYPVKPTWNESVKSVIAYGSASIKGLSTMGLDVSDFVLPISVRDNGTLVVADLRKKKPDRFAKPFTVNGGTGDLSGVAVNIGDPNLLLSMGKNQKLLQKVQINPVLASQVGSLASIIFNDAEEASGSLDLTVQECNNVALKQLMDKKATASFLYSVNQLKLNGKVPSALSQALKWGDEGITGDISDATLALKDGIANQDMTITLEHENAKAKGADDDGSKDKGSDDKTKTESLKFKGGIKLADNTFKDYNLTLSPGLLFKDIRKKFPDGATVALKGKATDVKGVLVQAVAQLAVQGYGEDAVNKILGGDKDKGGDNPLDKLLGKLNKKKTK